MTPATPSPLGTVTALAIDAWRPADPLDPFGEALRVEVPGCGPDTVWLDVESNLSLLLTDVGICRDGCHRFVAFLGSVGCFDGRWWWWAAAAELLGSRPEETERDARAKVIEACRLLRKELAQ